jgi:hypothetical protein
MPTGTRSSPPTHAGRTTTRDQGRSALAQVKPGDREPARDGSRVDQRADLGAQQPLMDRCGQPGREDFPAHRITITAGSSCAVRGDVVHVRLPDAVPILRRSSTRDTGRSPSTASRTILDPAPGEDPPAPARGAGRGERPPSGDVTMPSAPDGGLRSVCCPGAAAPADSAGAGPDGAVEDMRTSRPVSSDQATLRWPEPRRRGAWVFGLGGADQTAP